MKKAFLNTRNLLCPLPVIRVQEKVRVLSRGDILEVVGTDPGIMQDIPAWCRINGHRVLETQTRENDYTLLLKVDGKMIDNGAQ